MSIVKLISEGGENKMTKRPTKEQASRAGKVLSNPHTREVKESAAARTLAQRRWGKKS